jgi:hypothetical protein
MERMSDNIKNVGDAAAGGGAWVAIFGWLPDLLAAVAAILSIIWTAIRIWTWWRARKSRPHVPLDFDS